MSAESAYYGKFASARQRMLVKLALKLMQQPPLLRLLRLKRPQY